MENLVGTYKKHYGKYDRVLTITEQNESAHTLKATWKGSINYIPATFELTGIYVPWNHFNNQMLFSLVGQASNEKDQRVFHSAFSLVGFTEISGGADKAQTLHIIRSWAKDTPIEHEGKHSEGLGFWKFHMERQ